jgi:hypothetical protein
MKTTKRHFAFFRAECLRLAKRWNISGWELQFEHRESKGNYAAVTTHVVARVVIVVLATEWPNRSPSDAELRLCARHEMVHVLTEPLCSLSQCRHVTEDELNAGIHEVTMRLLQLLP